MLKPRSLGKARQTRDVYTRLVNVCHLTSGYYEYVEFYKAGLLCCFQYVFKNSSSFNSAVHHVPIKPVIFSFKVEPDQKSNGDSCGYEGNAEKNT